MDNIHLNCTGQEASMTCQNYSEREQSVLSIMWDYISAALNDVAVKTTLTFLGTSYAAISGGEPMLLAYLLMFMGADIVFGLADGIKNKEYSPYKLHRGVIKIFTYLVTIFLVCVISNAVNISTGINAHIQDFFMTYMLATEAISIMRHMSRLGFPVVNIFYRIAFGVQQKADDTIERMLPEKHEQPIQQTHQTDGDLPCYLEKPKDKE